MPLSTRAFCKPYLATIGHNSGGASSTLGQPRWTAVSQMRSMLHCHSVPLRHQYASDCLMRPFVTTRLHLRTGMHYSMRKHTSELRSDAQGGALCHSDPAKFGDGFLDGFEFFDEGQHGVFGVVQLFGLLEHRSEER